MEDAGKDETIRDKDDIDAHHNGNYQLIDMSTCAEELEKREHVTEKKANDIFITESQCQHRV